MILLLPGNTIHYLYNILIHTSTMKQISLVILFFVAMTNIQAQDFLISFSGSGSSNTVDSVHVENLTQGTSLSMAGNDQLNLLGTLSAINPSGRYTCKTLLVYPNPANEMVMVQFTTTTTASTTIELTDQSGRLLAQKKLFLQSGFHSFRFNGLTSGVYIVHVKSLVYQYTGMIYSTSSCGKTIKISYEGRVNDPGNTGYLKNTGSIIQMQYNSGDRLKFLGKSGNFRTVFMDIPDHSKTIIFGFVPCTDYDNNHYAVVQLGTQIWMVENLKSMHYADGTNVIYYDYDNNPDNSLIYGRLYAWSPAMKGAASSNTNPSNVQGICPSGWHLPSKAEWQQLGTSLGGLTNAGGKLKEQGISHWIAPNTAATDETGFKALPAGMHDFTNIFQWLGDHGAFSTSTGNLPMVEVTATMLQTSSGTLTMGTFHPDDALSTRCVKN
ncbi:MAG: FISUMP domain-containing protein [Bacteroidota bacterium]